MRGARAAERQRSRLPSRKVPTNALTTAPAHMIFKRQALSVAVCRHLSKQANDSSRRALPYSAGCCRRRRGLPHNRRHGTQWRADGDSGAPETDSCRGQLAATRSPPTTRVHASDSQRQATTIPLQDTGHGIAGRNGCLGQCCAISAAATQLRRHALRRAHSSASRS
jgi:hypothetical protein